MIHKDGKRLNLTKSELDVLIKEAGPRRLLEMQPHLMSKTKVKNGRDEPYVEESYPPSIMVPTRAVIEEDDGEHVYQYFTNTIIGDHGKVTYYPRYIEIGGNGLKVPENDLLYFLSKICPYVEGSEGAKSAKKKNAYFIPNFRFFNKAKQDRILAERRSSETKARNLIYNVWDEDKLMEVAASLFIKLPDDATKDSYSIAIENKIAASSDPNKWTAFITSTSDDLTVAHVEAVNMLTDEGIFSADLKKRVWYLVAGGEKQVIVKLQPSQLGAFKQILSDFLIKNPAIMAKAQAEYQKNISDITMNEDVVKHIETKRFESSDLNKDPEAPTQPEGGERVKAGESPVFDDTNITREYVEDYLKKALENEIIVKQGAWYKFGDKGVGQTEVKVIEKLMEDVDLLQEIHFELYPEEELTETE